MADEPVIIGRGAAAKDFPSDIPEQMPRYPGKALTHRFLPTEQPRIVEEAIQPEGPSLASTTGFKPIASFAYPDKRSKIPLLLSLVGVPLFLIIAFFINPPEGDMAGLGWIIFFVFIIPITTLVFLGISFFISKVAFKIDTQREIENKKSIFLRPIIISSVLLISFSALIYFEEQALPWHNDSLPEIIINALTGFSNKIPFVAVYIPIIAIMIFVWVYHAARK